MPKRKVKRTYKRKYQTLVKGRTARGLKVDRESRRAKPPGKRVSKTGRTYYEYRSNRTDLAHDRPKKWGKIGAPKSAKRKAWLKTIRRKR